MGEQTKISWCDHTFNPWVGCTPVSAACAFCYAERWAKRTGQAHLWKGDRRRTSETTWRSPLKWNEWAARDGVRRRVFCASLADVFDNQVPDAWRTDLWAMIFETPRLDWLLLTKRPQNIPSMLPPGWGNGWPNVWLGTTVENQQEADRRIPALLFVPAPVHFLSCEPLIGHVDLTSIIDGRSFARTVNCLSGESTGNDEAPYRRSGPRIDWVICGGESGPRARPMHTRWARSLRDQCAAADVAFHFKQWGGLRPESNGCALDGREHKEFPIARAV